MPELVVTEIMPHEVVLHMVVKKRALNEASTRKLVDDVHTAAAARPAVPIVLDLGQVKFAPSVALGSLMQMSKSYGFDGRRIALIAVDPNVREAIRVTHLDRLLQIHKTLDQAIASWA